ncbi:MAG: ABC transporter permease [Myxococcota bacterium]
MIREAAAQALRLVWAHKLRSLLTLFGLVWGTAAVIFLVGWGEGLRVMLDRNFDKTGKNLGQAWAGRIGEDFTPAVDRRQLWFSWEDVLAVRRRARIAERVSAERRHYLPVAAGQRALNMEVRGVEPVGIEIRNVVVAAGRQIQPTDLDHRRRVVVLGQTARERILGPGGEIGSRIRIGGRAFEVIGFLEPIGTQFGRDGDEIDEQAWIPLSTHFASWPDDWTTDNVVQHLLYRMPGRHLADETEREIRRLLADRLGVSPTDREAIMVWSPVTLLRTLPLDRQSGMLFVLAATTLIIGGIGVLNMMLDAVRERRREIGLRLAVGATRREIIAQFFLETFTIVSLGGLTGAAIGAGGCLFLASLTLPDVVPVPVLSWRVIAMALGVMGGVGLIAGVVPAWRAAQIDPALTLRAE